MKNKKKHIVAAFIAVMVVASVLIMPALGDGLVKKQYLEKPGTWCDQVENAGFGNAVALGDLDGDGFDDLIVAASSSSWKGVFVYYSRGDRSFEDPREIDVSRPTSIATADVNNDGFKDVIIVSDGYSGYIYAFYGGAARFPSSLSDTDADWKNTSVHPSSVDTIDVNADGIDDIIVGCPYEGKAYVFYGSPSGLPADLQPDAIIEESPTDNVQNGINYRLTGGFGSAVARDGVICAGTDCGSQFVIGVPGAAIDLNGDGYYGLYGGEENIGVALVGPRWQFLSGDNVYYAKFGYELGHVGDVNGDGENDLIISAQRVSGTPPKVFVYLGKSGFAKMNLDYAWAVEEPQAREYGAYTFGTKVGSAGDINGDGYDDIFIGDYRYDVRGGRSQADVGWWGRAYIWFGGPPSAEDPSGLGLNPTPQTADIILDGEAISGGFGQSFATGDINGDGFSDIVVGDPRGAKMCFDDQGESKMVDSGLVWVYLSSFGPGAADLSLSITDSPDPVTVGDPLTYTLVVQNNGPNDAPGATLSISLNPSTTFVSADTSRGSCTYSPGAPGSWTRVTCDLDTMAVGDDATVTVVVTPTTAGRIQGISTYLSSDITETVRGSEWTTVIELVDMPIADAGFDQTVNVGGPVQFDALNEDGNGDGHGVPESYDPDGTIVYYGWDIDGDGTDDLTGPDPTHAFTTAGTYTVALTVQDDSGMMDDDQMVVTVLPLAGDFNGNGAIDYTDFTLFLDAFGTCAGDAGYLEAADLDGDGCITCADYQAFLAIAGFSEPVMSAVEYAWGEPAPGYSYVDWPIFEGWMTVRIENTGTSAAENVRAAILTVPENVVVVDGDVTLNGNIPAGSSVWSSDTFRIRVDTSNLVVDPTEGIFWKVKYDANGEHIVEVVPEFPGSIFCATNG